MLCMASEHLVVFGDCRGMKELGVGSNTGDPDMEARVFAVGRILGSNSTQWIHLDINDVKALIKEHGEKHGKTK